MRPTSIPSFEASSRPLHMPEEVWASFSHDVKEVYERAQVVLDTLHRDAAVSVRRISAATRLSAADILQALYILRALGLAALHNSGRETVVELIAVPVEHVSVVDPDGTTRWFFLARPLSVDPDPSSLN